MKRKEKKRDGTFPSDPEYLAENNFKGQIIQRCFYLAWKCRILAGIILPNVLLRHHFTFLNTDHLGSRGWAWFQEGVWRAGWGGPDVWNWMQTTASYHPSWSTCVCLPVSRHRARAFSDLSLHMVTLGSSSFQHTVCPAPISGHSQGYLYSAGGSPLTQGLTATSKSNHIWSRRQAVYRRYQQRHFGYIPLLFTEEL